MERNKDGAGVKGNVSFLIACQCNLLLFLKFSHTKNHIFMYYFRSKEEERQK